MARKLVMDLDENQHGADRAQGYAVTTWLETQGFRVVRSSNDDVTRSIGSVLDTIIARVAQTQKTSELANG